MHSNENNEERIRFIAEAECCLAELCQRHAEVKNGIPPRIAGLSALLQEEIARMLVDLLKAQNHLCSIYNRSLERVARNLDESSKEAAEFFRQRNELFLVVGQLIDVCEKAGLGDQVQRIKRKLRHDLAEGLLLEDFQQYSQGESDES